MPIPAQDLALLRGRTHIIKPKLNMFPLQVVATAQIATTPAQYPIGSVDIQDTVNWNKVKPGQLFRIVDSNNDIVTYGVVRLAPTSNILYIDGKARGDAGYARRILRAIKQTDTVSVFSFEPIWTLLSRIYQGKFYKNFDVPYVDQGAKPYPVCNIGQWRQVDANYFTGKGRISFSNSRSFAWFGSNIISYSWSVPSGTTFVTGSVSTSNIVIDLPAGFHLIYCTITDSRGKTQTSFRPVWVNHPVLYPAISDVYALEITGDSQDRQGREMSFRITGDIPPELFIPGGAILFTEEDIYDNGDHLSDGIAINNYVGFMSQETPHLDLVGQKSMEIATKSPYKRMADIPMVSQAILEAPSPTDWTQIANRFSTVDFVTWYILKHHTTFLDGFDFEGLRETVNPARKKNWGLNGTTIAEYLEQMGKMIRGNIGSASDGTIYLRRDPTIEENDFRNALDERMTWTIHDILEPVDIGTEILPTVGQVRCFAFAYGTQEELNAVASIAPGFVQGMGPSKQDEESILVGDPATAQDKINRISGHVYAKLNNPQPEIQLKVNRNMDVADPASMLWHRIDINSALTPRNERIYTRVLPKSIDRSWENNGGAWIKRITTTFETETYGQPGETYIVDKGGGSVYPPIDPGTENQIPDAINFQQFKFVIALDTTGNLGLTTNGNNWRKINSDVPGRICDIAIDWASEYIKSGFVNGALAAWITALDDDGKTIRLYYTSDILFANISWQLAAEKEGNIDSGSGIGVSNSIRVLTYPEDPDHILVVYWDPQGTHCFYTLNAAATISPTLDFNDTGETDITSRDAYIGADVDSDGTLATSGISFAGQNYQMLFLPKGGDDTDWSFINESPNGNAPYPMIKLNKNQSEGLATKLNKAVSTNQQAIINTSTHQVGNPLNADGGTSGTYRTYQDQQWIADNPDIDSPICGHTIPTDSQPPLDFVFFSRQTYGKIAGGGSDENENIDAGEYTVSVSMVMELDGKWDIDQIDYSWALNALAYSGAGHEVIDTSRGGVPYFRTDGAYVHLNLRVLGSGKTLYGFDNDMHYTNDLYITNYGGTTYYCIGGVTDGGFKTGTIGTGLNIKGATTVKLTLSTTYVSHKGEETSLGFDFFEAPWHCLLGISGITVYGTTVTKDTPRLYQFEDYMVDPATYTHVSPDGIWAPFHPYGLAIDPVINSQVASVMTRGSGTSNSLFTSVNGGTNYNARGFVQYVGLRKVGDTALFFGKDKLDISSKGISPVADITGDWETIVSKTSNNTFTNAISVATIA